MAGEVLTKLWDSPGPVAGRPSQDHLLAKGALAGRSQQGTADTASEPAGWAWPQGHPGSLGIWPRSCRGRFEASPHDLTAPSGGGAFISGPPGMGKGC